MEIDNLAIKATPIGAEYGLETQRSSSDIYELIHSVGLRVVVTTQPRGSLEQLWLEFHFSYPVSFRYLDEGDMMRWWKHDVFYSNHHLYEILEGGWLVENTFDASITKPLGSVREWLIKTSNGCVSVISPAPPEVRELLTR